MKKWKIRNDYKNCFINNEKNITFESMVNRLNKFEIENILLKAGFELNKYAEGTFWEISYSINDVGEYIFSQVCKAFKYDRFEETDIALQCNEDFSRSVFCIDAAVYEMSIDEFIKCVEELL